MVANSLAEMAASLRLFVPNLPYPLARQFIRDRYRRILRRRNWSALRGEGEFLLGDAKTAGTVTVTRGSITVTGLGTAFAATDVGRQFKAATGVIYTILTVDVLAQTLTLDRVYGGVNAAGIGYFVFDAYLSVPTDFRQFVYIVDPDAGYRLRHWHTQEELIAWDPQHSSFGQPYCIIDRRFNGTTPQYEAWPYNTVKRNLPYFYIKDGLDLDDEDDIPIFPIPSDAIVSGALADLCRWPGTKEVPNPMFFKADVMRSYEIECEDKLVEVERTDEDLYTTWLKYAGGSEFPIISTNYLFNHAI